MPVRSTPAFASRFSVSPRPLLSPRMIANTWERDTLLFFTSAVTPISSARALTRTARGVLMAGQTSTDMRTGQAHGALQRTGAATATLARLRPMADDNFPHVWDAIEAARLEDPTYRHMEKWLGRLGSMKGDSLSKSTWYSYQRWFRGGEGTSPRLDFLLRVAGMLRLRLAVDVVSSTARTRPKGEGTRLANDPDILFVAELMAELPQEARDEVRKFTLSKVGELARPPEGDEPPGQRPSPR